MRNYIVLMAMAISAFFVNIAIANGETLQDGVDAYNDRDYANAMYILTPIAESGDRVAQTLLASMYFWGDGVVKNDFEAAYWYEKSALNNVPVSQRAIAIMYADGIGVQQNYSVALMWFGIATMNGDRLAMINFGQARSKASQEDYELSLLLGKHCLNSKFTDCPSLLPERKGY